MEEVQINAYLVFLTYSYIKQVVLLTVQLNSIKNKGMMDKTHVLHVIKLA